LRILAVTSANSGVGYHRIMMPLVHMQKDYCMITDTLTDELFEKGNYDIMVMNRFLSNIEIETIIELRKRFGFKLIVDNDDHWKLDPSHILAQRYHDYGITDYIIRYIEIADLCTTTHERLADEISQYNKNVKILPNALPYGKEQFLDNKVDSDLVRFFWSGSGTHIHDLDLLKNPMKRCVGLPIHTIMAGYNEQEKILWDRMIGSFTCGLKLNPKIFNYNEVTKYMAAYADSDVSVIPLVDNKFNSMKSNLKVLETAAKKNPAIVSEINPYLGLPVHYVKKQGDWFKHIRDLTFDHDMRIDSGLKLFEYCQRNFNFDKINSERFSIYKQLIS
jgi:hypothetical protein